MAEYTIRNKRLDDDEFLRIRREEVLPMWETGKQLENLEECIEAARECCAGKNYADLILKAEAENRHLLQPQFGQATTDMMIEGMTYVEDNSPLQDFGLWNIFSDSYTRKCNFKMAQVGIDRSVQEGVTDLNGWAIVNYGVEEARRL